MQRGLFAGVVLGLVSGCGGSGGTSPSAPEPNAVVFISAPPASLAVNATATVSAAATFPYGATGNAAVTWTVTCGSPGACGSFGANDNGGAVTFKAPSAIPSGNTVTVIATSVANVHLSVASAVTIVAPIPIAVSLSPTPPASIEVGASVPLNATVSHDVSANPAVTWTATCSSAACGSFEPASTMSQASTTYTAPPVIPTGGSVTLSATSVTDPTQSASVRIVVTALGPTLANGTYVFQIAGLPGSQASFVTGVFTARDGQITGGEQDSLVYSTDVDGNAYGSPVFQAITGGNYTTTADGNEQVSLALGAGAVETLYGTLDAAHQGFVAGINGSMLSASLDLQSSTAAPSGGYAISLFGGDGFEAPVWLAGVINVDGPGSISGAGSILDLIDSGSEPGPYTLSASSVSAPDPLGRVQISLTPTLNSQPSGSTLLPVTLAGYIVDATHIRLIGSGSADNAGAFQGVLGGLALGQDVQTGKFGTSAVAGLSYVFGAQGSDLHGSLQLAGLLTLNADGSATGLLDWNDLSGNAARTPRAFSGTFAVDPTGRLTLTHLADGSTFDYSMHVYLAAGGNALLLSNDPNDSFAGQGFLRTGTTFSASPLNGRYGLNFTQLSPQTTGYGLQDDAAIGTLTASAESGATAASGATSVAGFADAANGGADVAIGGSIAAARSGVASASLEGLDPRVATTPGSFALYVINDTQAVVIETDSTALALGELQGP